MSKPCVNLFGLIIWYMSACPPTLSTCTPSRVKHHNLHCQFHKFVIISLVIPCSFLSSHIAFVNDWQGLWEAKLCFYRPCYQLTSFQHWPWKSESEKGKEWASYMCDRLQALLDPSKRKPPISLRPKRQQLAVTTSRLRYVSHQFTRGSNIWKSFSNTLAHDHVS